LFRSPLGGGVPDRQGCTALSPATGETGMMSVTVVIPTFNRWPQVCTAIDSVLQQSYPATRCMVVDDGSSDDTVQRLEEKYGAAIDLVKNPVNRGQSFCKNLGASSATSDFVCFL